MTGVLLALALALGPPGHPGPAPEPRPVAAPFAGPDRRTPVDTAPEDGLRHLGLSFAATGFTYGAARIGLTADAALMAAATTAALAGIGKEIHDHRRGGRASVTDLLWDAAGLLVGIALVRQIR